MVRYTLKRFLRAPVPAIAVILFATILSTILCGVQAANEREEMEYRQICRTIPVDVYVSNLTGTSIDNLSAPRWVMDAMRLFLNDHVKDLQGKASVDIHTIAINDEPHYNQMLVGITSLSAAGELAQGSQELVTWQDGFDESFLQGTELVCILPETMVPDGTQMPISVQLHFESNRYNASQAQFDKFEIDRIFRVVGVHGNNSGIYCPLAVVEILLSQLDRELVYDRVGGVLIDNFGIQELRDAASKWFVEPSLSGKTTPWDKNGYSYYPYALMIDDSQLRAAEETLETSLTINRICTMLVFVLSAGAGFLIGFLMIRSRKREIALMRTMGTPNISIYGGFAFEQMLCVVLGTLLGGSAFRWQPEGRLLTFVCIYFVGLTVALLIFLHTNLISTIKEDE